MLTLRIRSILDLIHCPLDHQDPYRGWLRPGSDLCHYFRAFFVVMQSPAARMVFGRWASIRSEISSYSFTHICRCFLESGKNVEI